MKLTTNQFSNLIKYLVEEEIENNKEIITVVDDTEETPKTEKIVAAKERLEYLQANPMGFSYENSLAQTLREFPEVTAADLDGKVNEEAFGQLSRSEMGDIIAQAEDKAYEKGDHGFIDYVDEILADNETDNYAGLDEYTFRNLYDYADNYLNGSSINEESENREPRGEALITTKELYKLISDRFNKEKLNENDFDNDAYGLSDEGDVQLLYMLDADGDLDDTMDPVITVYDFTEFEEETFDNPITPEAAAKITTDKLMAEDAYDAVAMAGDHDGKLDGPAFIAMFEDFKTYQTPTGDATEVNKQIKDFIANSPAVIQFVSDIDDSTDKADILKSLK